MNRAFTAAAAVVAAWHMQGCAVEPITPIRDVVAHADSLRANRTQVVVRGTVLSIEHPPLTKFYISTIGDNTGTIKIVSDSSSCVAAKATITGTVSTYNLGGMLRFGPVVVEDKRTTRGPACRT